MVMIKENITVTTIEDSYLQDEADKNKNVIDKKNNYFKEKQPCQKQNT